MESKVFSFVVAIFRGFQNGLTKANAEPCVTSLQRCVTRYTAQVQSADFSVQQGENKNYKTVSLERFWDCLQRFYSYYRKDLQSP